MKVAIEQQRSPIHGLHVTQGIDGLLDRWGACESRSVEAVKQLRKVAFSYPQAHSQIDMVIRILEGKG